MPVVGAVHCIISGRMRKPLPNDMWADKGYLSVQLRVLIQALYVDLQDRVELLRVFPEHEMPAHQLSLGVWEMLLQT